jgi:hypothetical protein
MAIQRIQLLLLFAAFLLKPTSSQQTCPICERADIYPGNVNRVIVARYVGQYTCGQLYYRGMNGQIPGFMCGPLQDYAQEPCDCKPGNPHPSEYQAPASAPFNIPPGIELPPSWPNYHKIPSPTLKPTQSGPGGLPPRKTAPQTGKDALKLSRSDNSNTLGGLGGGRKLRGVSKEERREVLEE